MLSERSQKQKRNCMIPGILSSRLKLGHNVSFNVEKKSKGRFVK